MPTLGLVVAEFSASLTASMEERARERIANGARAVPAALDLVAELP